MKILKFAASWCGPCKVLGKTFDNMDSYLKDKNISLELVDIEDENNDELVTKYGIRSVPVLIFLDSDEKELERSVGAIPENKIKSIIEKYVKD